MEEINIKDFFIYLKKYIIAFVVAIVVALTGVFVYDGFLKKPIYQAKTTIVVAKSDNTELTSSAALNDINASQKLISTYGEIAKSELVLGQVINNLELPISVKELGRNVTVKPVDDTAILSIQVKDKEPEQAAVIANEIADVFTDEIGKIYKLDNVSQLSMAKTPEAPANNTTMRDLILGAFAAIFVVSGFAFLKFYLDDTVKHGDEIEKTFGLPVTGKISRETEELDNKKKVGAKDELIVKRSPKAIVSENIKSLRTNLQFTAIDKETKTILITSTNPGEGKSFVSANLATSFAQADKKVLIVDCDLRKGRLHTLLKVLNKKGLSNLLTDDLKNVDDYIQKTGIKNLEVITCGTYPPNPSELLASAKNKRLVSRLKMKYDVVIFDGAPVTGLADSVILSRLMDSTLMVVKEGSTAKNDLLAAKDALLKVGAKNLGLVFNMIKRRGSSYYYYYGEQK